MNGVRTVVAVLLVSLVMVPGVGAARPPTPNVGEGSGVHLMSGPPPVLVAWSAAPAPAEPVSPPPGASASTATQALWDLPLRFVPQTGTDAASSFTVHGANHAIVLTEGEVIFRAVDLATADPRLSARHGVKLPIPDIQFPTTNATVRLRFPGANPHPRLEGLSPLGGVVNYFLGNDPARWRSNVSTYGAVVYRELYPGVDLVYRGTAGHLKSEFRVAPGVDPGAIQMAYAGAEALCLRDGALVLETALGELVEEAPLVYQVVAGVRRAVPGGYVVLGEDRVGFQVGAYDPALPLIIDPELTYSSYLGGSDEDRGYGIAVDDVGNIYVTGSTHSADFPTRDATDINLDGSGDVFVTQIVNANGVYTYGYSTYLGGSSGEQGNGIAVSLSGVGGVYIAGVTVSPDFPTHNAVQPSYGGDPYDAFVTQIISVGGVYTLGYSTYLGGSSDEYGWDIAVDGAGNAYVVGDTYSADFPVTANAIRTARASSDAFVTQIVGASGVYTYGYSTYLGGTSEDYGYAITVDGASNIYVTGMTGSADFPTRNAVQPNPGSTWLPGDVFVTQLIGANGVYTYGYSTYLGGSSDEDRGWDIAVDGAGNTYVTGWTGSTDFPITANAIDATYGGWSWYDAFVTQIISAGGVYTYGYSTYLGGSGDEHGFGIAVPEGRTNSVYVTGYTRSSDFPTHNALDTTLGGSHDVFVTQIISANGVYTYGYSTYLGGSGADYGWRIVVDGASDVLVTGYTDSSDFPTHNATQMTYGGGDWDALVFKLGPVGLALRKAVTPAVVGPGQTVTYTLTYDNSSSVTATQVLITDVVPITVTQVHVTSSVPLTPTGSVSCTWQAPPLAPGGSGVITITGIVSPAVSGVFTLTNRARIASTSPYFVDENPADDEAAAVNTVDADPPAAPEPLSPASGALTNDTTPTLVWLPSASPDTAGYLLDWNGTPLDVGLVTQYTLPPLDDGTYTWTVSAYDAAGNAGTCSCISLFTVDATPPAVVAVAPGDGTTGVALTVPLVVTFSEPIAAGTLAYAVTPDPGGWSVAWDAGSTVVTLTHAAFAYWTTHTVTVTAAADRAGNPLADAPYTWHWTTVPYRLYLPLAMRGYQ